MARIMHCLPGQIHFDYHIYTDLDFWDARRILKDLASVRRNFGNAPLGDEFPTQVLGEGLGRAARREIEKRLKRAVVSPPRHVIVDGMLAQGFFEFDPLRYYPKRWSWSRMMHFTYYRLPLRQGALETPCKKVRLSRVEGRIRVEQVRRKEKYDPVIKDRQEARRRRFVPSCF